MDAAEHVERFDGERTESVLQDDFGGQGDDLGDGVADLVGVEVLAGETPEGPGQDALLCRLLVLDTAQSWREQMRETAKIITSHKFHHNYTYSPFICSPEHQCTLLTAYFPYGTTYS